MNGNVAVFTRMRPHNEGEKKDQVYAFKIENNSIQQNVEEEHTERSVVPTFVLDHIFDQKSKNEDIFKCCAQDIVASCLNGFNGVIFAYGQTSSGKTHSMFGNKSEMGVIPLAVNQVFKFIQQSRREWLLRVSFLEIYNEELHDLLNPQTDPKKLIVYEKEGNVCVKNLREEIVTSEKHTLDLLERGIAMRRTASTKMNDRSSRSHAVFSLVSKTNSPSKNFSKHSIMMILQDYRKQRDQFGRIQVEFLRKPQERKRPSDSSQPFDLAGSERAKKTDSEAKTFKEGASINKSLLTLSKVIRELSKMGDINKDAKSQKKQNHVSYRDSKLTRILKLGLGGNSKLSIICCITPSLVHLEESISTLRFATNAKKIQNNTFQNQVLDESALLKKYKREIEELRSKITESQKLLHEKKLMKQEIEQARIEKKQLEDMVNQLTGMILVGTKDEEAAKIVLNLRRVSSLSGILNLKEKMLKEKFLNLQEDINENNIDNLFPLEDESSEKSKNSVESDDEKESPVNSDDEDMNQESQNDATQDETGADACGNDGIELEDDENCHGIDIEKYKNSIIEGDLSYPVDRQHIEDYITFRHQVESLEKEKDELVQENINLKKENIMHQKLKDEVGMKFKKEIDMMKESIRQLEERNLQCIETNSKLSQQYETTITRLENRIQEQEKYSQELRQQMLNKEINRRALEEQLTKEYERSILALRKSLIEEQQKNRQLLSELIKKEQQIVHSKHENRTLLNQVHISEQKVSDLKDEVVALSSMLRRMGNISAAPPSTVQNIETPSNPIHPQDPNTDYSLNPGSAGKSKGKPPPEIPPDEMVPREQQSPSMMASSLLGPKSYKQTNSSENKMLVQNLMSDISSLKTRMKDLTQMLSEYKSQKATTTDD